MGCRLGPGLGLVSAAGHSHSQPLEVERVPVGRVAVHVVELEADGPAAPLAHRARPPRAEDLPLAARAPLVEPEGQPVHPDGRQRGAVAGGHELRRQLPRPPEPRVLRVPRAAAQGVAPRLRNWVRARLGLGRFGSGVGGGVGGEGVG